MLKNLLTLLTISIIILSQNFLYAQGEHELIVPEDQTLNQTIADDVDGSGARLDLDRIYVLKRGTTYYIDGSIANIGYPLRIYAEEGDGDMPQVKLLASPFSGNYPFVFVWMNNDVTLKGIAISGIPDDDDTYCWNSVVFVEASGFDLNIDGCVFANVSGQMVRTNLPLSVLKVTNTTLGNIGFISTSSFGTGKGIDFRAGSVDSAIFINNTWVNIQDRLIRHRNSEAALNYFEFRNNSVLVSMSYDGLFELGAVGEKVIIEDNLFVDAYTFGRDTTDAARLEEHNGHGEYEDDGIHFKMVIIATDPPVDSISTTETQFRIRNNYLSYTQEQKDWWGTRDIQEPYPLTTRITNALSNPDNALIREDDLAITERPALPLDLMNWYYDVAGKERITTPDHDYDRKSLDWMINTVNGQYPTTSAAYTGATDGQMVGSRMWWPGFVVGVEDNVTSPVPSEFNLEQNYPNPFNPSTTISYALPEKANVTVKIYDILGSEVASLVENKEQNAGNYDVKFNANSLTSGIYFYTLNTGNFVQTKKMILLK